MDVFTLVVVVARFRGSSLPFFTNVSPAKRLFPMTLFLELLLLKGPDLLVKRVLFPIPRSV
jgi:hypothetical protein